MLSSLLHVSLSISRTKNKAIPSPSRAIAATWDHIAKTLEERKLQSGGRPSGVDGAAID